MSMQVLVEHGEPAPPTPPPVIDNTRQPLISDMTALLNDLSYIPPNNKHNEPTQGDIGLASIVPRKVLRYFPIIPRLQRLYKSSHTAKEMIWHATGKCTEPGKMQHPVDGRAWKNFDTKYPDFAKEPRNVRLGLAADGIQSVRQPLVHAYNMWPGDIDNIQYAFLVCMKESSFMLTLLILGPKSLGEDIDVYLRPLIEDLKTINDFPARSSLSGWSGQGYKACPTCNKDTPSVRVLSKTAYVGHIRFLKKPHKWRSSLEFNGQTDNRDPPKEFGWDEILAQLDRLPTRVKGKHLSYRGVNIKRNVHVELNWTKRSIFYELEYWSFYTTQFRHHAYQKNVLEAILNTLLMNDKSKDTAKARQDLQRLGIRSGLWLGQTKNEKCLKPQAAYSFTPENQKKSFCGPIRPRWMFPFERYMKKLKEEALTFSSHYFRDVTTKFNRLDRNVDPPPPTCQFQVFRSIRQRHVDNDKDPEVSTTSELFALACGPTWTPISINSCVVDGVRGEAFKNDQYILVTQVKQVFYLEDKAKPHWKVVEHVNHKKFSNGGVIVVEDDPKILHFNNSSDLPLSTSLNDLDNATLHIDGQSTEVDAPPDIIDVVDEDDDIIDDEDALPHDLADSDDEDLINVDDDGVDKMSADVARSHGGDGGGEDRPPPHHTQFDLRPHMESPDWTEIDAGIQRTLQKAYNTNKAAFKGPALGYRPRDRDLQCEEDQAARPRGHCGEEGLSIIQDPGRLLPPRDEMRQSSATQEYPSLIDTFFVAHTVNGEEIRRLEATGTYTDDEINRLARREFESGGASGSGGCGDDEESADDQEDEDGDGDGDS
ncbi:hypothetical protein Tco_0149719 [Tanacetum coccineum]